jgi:hypothetical protein
MRSDFEADLRWWLSGEHEGDLGLRAAPLEVAPSPTFAPKGLTSRQYDAAERLNEIRRRWEQLTDLQQDVLLAAFGPRRPGGLDAWGDLAPVVLITPGARDGYRAYKARCGARAHRSFTNWLDRLSHRALNEVGQQQQFDAELVASLRTEAESLLVDAVTAYEGAKGRRKRAA